MEVNVARGEGGGEGGEDAKAVFELLAFGEGAAAALRAGRAFVAALVAEFADEEVTVPLSRDAALWLISGRGARVKAFNKDFGVWARMAGEGLAPGSGGGGAFSALVRGSRAALAAALPALQTLLAEHASSCEEISATALQAKVVKGGGGATITRLRAEHPGVAIEVDEGGGA